ncbi:MAG: AAA family ATPase [Thermoguttaceae bacterium]
MDRLIIENFGPITKADVEFGDLTVLVGPQGTGKSLFLAWLKLALDTAIIKKELNKHGFDWRNDSREFIDLYFGEGVGCAMNESFRIETVFGNKTLKDDNHLEKLLKRRKTKTQADDNVFYIPAQRVVILSDGWPKPFTAFKAKDPFVVRDFSEKMRLIMEGREGNEVISQKYFRKEFKDGIANDIYRGMDLRIDHKDSQKRLVLESQSDKNQKLPIMAWSAGQREFASLMLGFHWLMPASKTVLRKNLKWAIIEEPEMGLHPKAICVVLGMICDLLHRGYKVCVSTHSNTLLEFVWAVTKIISNQNRHDKTVVEDAFLKLFGLPKNQNLQKMASNVLEKSFKVYYFGDHSAHNTKDISTLDLWSEESDVANWGGIAEFGTRAGEVVSEVVS